MLSRAQVGAAARWVVGYAKHLATAGRGELRAVSPQFVARETTSSLRRHVGTAVAIVVTATLALVMLGGALLLHAQIDDLKGAWYDKTQVTAYLSQDATTGQISALHDRLSSDTRVSHIWFEDHALAYKNFAQQFRDAPELVSEVSADQMPESFRIQLVHPSQGAGLVSDLGAAPGVRHVVDEHAQLATLFDVLGGFQHAALILALIQAFAAVVLISNMVRSTILLRAEEIAVGRIMGASRAQLAAPFLAEVVLYGVLGTLTATALLALGKHELIDTRLAHSGVLSGVVGYVGWDALWQAVPWLLLAGVGLPALVSAVALRRHLDR